MYHSPQRISVVLSIARSKRSRREDEKPQDGSRLLECTGGTKQKVPHFLFATVHPQKAAKNARRQPL
jgi:hypothetical protein